MTHWQALADRRLDQPWQALPGHEVRRSSPGLPWPGLMLWHQVGPEGDLYVPPTAEHTILFRLWHEGDLLRLEIEDDGRPFDPTAQAIADTAAGLEQRKIGGLGIHFIRRTMAGMTYRRQGDRNILTLIARLADSAAPANS